jgi:hypothetical protein
MEVYLDALTWRSMFCLELRSNKTETDTDVATSWMFRSAAPISRHMPAGRHTRCAWDTITGYGKTLDRLEEQFDLR